MEEPVRLVCPDCNLVYRVKKLTLGKDYKCKACGAGLHSLDPVALQCSSCGAEGGEERLNPAEVPACPSCGGKRRLASPAGGAVPPEPEHKDKAAAHDPEAHIARENAAAASSTDSVHAQSRPAPSVRRRVGSLGPESDLTRLPKMIEDLTARLELLRNVGIGDGCEPADTATKLLEITDKLAENLRALSGKMETDFLELEGRFSELDSRFSGFDEKFTGLDDKFTGFNDRFSGFGDQFSGFDGKFSELDGRFLELDGKLNGLAEKMPSGDLAALSEQVKETGSVFLTRLEEYREAQKTELAALLAPSEEPSPNTTVEVDMDELADRLVQGIRGRTPLDSESGSAVDALARVADELVREQSSNTAQLDSLAAEVKRAIAGIGKMDEWRGDLPIRVAEDISRMVEERVVGPVSIALSKQAPAILAELQDSKLVDIVSRAVREAQRPLLREILSGGRGGVPPWLFASVLIPLLLILGYLYWPGMLGITDEADRLDSIAVSLRRLESEGVPVAMDADSGMMQNIEFDIQDIKEKALEHAHNTGKLEERVRSLEEEIKKKDQLIKDYHDTVTAQNQRIKSYEARLIQLSVSPDSIP